MAYVNVCILRRLKGELAWAMHKQLRVVSNKMLFKNSYTTLIEVLLLAKKDYSWISRFKETIHHSKSLYSVILSSLKG